MLHNRTKWNMLSHEGDKLGLPSEKCTRLGRIENILHMAISEHVQLVNSKPVDSMHS